MGVTIIRNLGAELGQLHQEVIALMSGIAEGLEDEGELRTAQAQSGPPRCPGCRAGLFEEARYKGVEVPAEDPESDEGVVSVTLIYCNRCGTALGTT